MDDGGLQYQADARHIQEMLVYFGLGDDSKGLSAAIVKDFLCEGAEGGEVLGGAGSKAYRALAPRANYLALGRPVIQYAAKELCRVMSRPTAQSMAKMKRLAGIS